MGFRPTAAGLSQNQASRAQLVPVMKTYSRPESVLIFSFGVVRVTIATSNVCDQQSFYQSWVLPELPSDQTA